MDANNRPVLNTKGFVTQNTQGVWSILCDDKIDFSSRGLETAGFVCINLGFKGYQFMNRTVLTSATLDVSRTTRHSTKHVINEQDLQEMRMEQWRRESSTGRSPERNNENFEPIVGSAHKECGALYVECVPFATGQHMVSEDKTKTLDFNPIIHPAQKPVVVVEPVKEIVTNPVTIRFPWIAEIYINGRMRGLGILLEHYWVLTTSLTLESIE